MSQARTPEFDAGYDRIFGDKKPERGRWVVTPNGLVPAEEYVPPARALDAPIMSGRFYENTGFDDGERVRDLGSRRKHREFMAEKGWTHHSDFKEYRQQYPAMREREERKSIDTAMEKAKRKLYQQGKWR